MNKMQRTVKYPPGLDSAIIDLLSSLRADVHDELSALSSGGITPIVAGNYQISGAYKETVRITGTITGNEEFVVSNEVRKYLIINDWSCSSDKYVYIKTKNGNGVYMAPGDMWSVYCDGTNIVNIKKLNARTITLIPSTTQNITAGNTNKVTFDSVSGDVLSEVASSVWTAKNSGVVSVAVAIAGTASSGATYLTVYVYRNGVALMTQVCVDYSPSLGYVAYMESRIAVNAGDTLAIYLRATGADHSITSSSRARITIE